MKLHLCRGKTAAWIETDVYTALSERIGLGCSCGFKSNKRKRKAAAVAEDGSKDGSIERNE